jgi:hypothetical protein
MANEKMKVYTRASTILIFMDMIIIIYLIFKYVN